MNIFRHTTPVARVWTLDACPRAPFVRLVADNARRPRLIAAWSLNGSGRLVRAWIPVDEPAGRRPFSFRTPRLPALFRRAA